MLFPSGRHHYRTFPTLFYAHHAFLHRHRDVLFLWLYTHLQLSAADCAFRFLFLRTDRLSQRQDIPHLHRARLPDELLRVSLQILVMSILPG